MATNRKKKTLIQGVTREQAEQALTEYAKALAQQKKIAADIELETAKIREKYAADVEALTGQIDTNFAILEAYATANPDLFVKKKSLDMLSGVIGFRTGMPKFVTDKGFTQAAVITLIKENLPSRVADFVNVTEVLNKQGIINEFCKADDDENRMDLDEFRSTCHCNVIQDEAFYVTAKEEEVKL